MHCLATRKAARNSYSISCPCLFHLIIRTVQMICSCCLILQLIWCSYSPGLWERTNKVKLRWQISCAQYKLLWRDICRIIRLNITPKEDLNLREIWSLGISGSSSKIPSSLSSQELGLSESPLTPWCKKWVTDPKPSNCSPIFSRGRWFLLETISNCNSYLIM